MKNLKTYKLFETDDSNQKQLGEKLLDLGYTHRFYIHLDDLVKQGVNINYKDKYGNTALMKHVMKNNLYAIKYLLNYNADIDSQNNVGWTALMLAANAGYIRITEFLLDRGANPSIKNDGDLTFIENAAPNIIKELLSSKYNQEILLKKYPELFTNLKKLGIINQEIANRQKFSHLNTGVDLNLL